jgi:hypothetical protein
MHEILKKQYTVYLDVGLVNSIDAILANYGIPRSMLFNLAMKMFVDDVLNINDIERNLLRTLVANGSKVINR